eukprot:scaffold4372_cov397-Prasinococcus_capsulatus_cf.AAC.3
MTSKWKILKLAKGYQGRSNCIRVARQQVERALQHAYKDRRLKKRDSRSNWIQSINAGAREYGVRIAHLVCFACDSCFGVVASAPRVYPEGARVQMTYSTLMSGLAKDNIQLDRKSLSALSVHEPLSFRSIVEHVKRMSGTK